MHAFMQMKASSKLVCMVCDMARNVTETAGRWCVAARER